MLKKLGTIAAGLAIVVSGGVATASTAAVPDTKAAVATSTSMVGVSEHDNVLNLEAGNSYISEQGISFEWDSGYSITDGQPWGGVSGNGQPSINVEAGRQGSSGPAQWFNDRAAAAFNDGPWANSPDELNFAFSGWLTIEGHQYPVVMGQGHDMESANNWWFGGQGSGWGAGHGQIVTPDGLYMISVGPEAQSNSFTIASSAHPVYPVGN